MRSSDAKPIIWVKCSTTRDPELPSIFQGHGGHETIYRKQYFWKAYLSGGVSLHATRGLSGIYIPHNDSGCMYCGCGGVDYAVRLFKPTAKTKTIYSDFEACPVGFCHRIRFKINEHIYWAKWNPLKKHFMVFNQHHSRLSMGSLPKHMIPKALWEQFT